MIKKILNLFFAIAICIALLPSANVSAADFTVSVNSNDHTIMLPLEKSFRFVATIKNTSSKTKRFNVRIPEGQGPKDPSKDNFTVLSPEGFFELKSGQEINYVITFEANPNIQRAKGQSLNTKLAVSSDGAEQSINISVKSDALEENELRSHYCSTPFSVVDKKTKKEINGAKVLAMLPSGMETKMAQSRGGALTLESLCGDYMNQISEQYKIDHSSKGHYLQVSAQGYKSYFEPNFLPTSSQKKIELEALDQVGEYTKTAEISSGFSIWWIKASSDNKYFAFSQGTHGSPSTPEPTSSKVIFTDDSGKELWSKTAGGQCWGLDVSSSGNYVAAGCHDGKVYVWDKSGKELMSKGDNKEAIVRWVKFSPDEKYLIAGPANNRSEESGLYEVSTGKLIWSKYTGGYLREGRFSEDGKIVYLSSGNGTVYALNTSDGSEIWLGSGNFYIPFVLGASNSANTIIASGKGRAFTALDLQTGKQKWSTIIDQTITAGEVAEDGTTVGNSVGGMAYGIANDGKINWARNYGGVGHNGVFYTLNGKYVIFGGPNPTLFDSSGNVLWQREKDKKIQMTGPVETNTGGAYDTWMSEDGSLIILGGDDGNITFYKGSVKNGKNSYSQITGNLAGTVGVGENNNSAPGAPIMDDQKEPLSLMGVLLPIIGTVIILGLIIFIIIKIKKRQTL